ncbi:MAG: RNA polymerase sigma factor [Clostridia bacterium]|nr:RNA polymerase sigma factor [Clostridia bacterium]
MTEHYKYLYSYVLSRVSDFHDAEDIVQETYLTALQKRDDFRGESHIRTWLCGIAENKIRQHIRRRGIALSRHAEAEEEIPESDPDRLIAAEELEMLRKSVADLPPELRECAVVSILCGMDGRDAAEILGVPVQVVYNRVHRIKKLLRGKLEDHMETSLEIFSSLLNEGMTAVERTAAHFRQFYDLCDARDSEGAARLLLTSPVFASDSAMAHFMIMQQCDMAVRVMRLGKDDPVTRQLASLGAQEFRLAQKLGLCGILDDDTGEELPEHFFYDCAAQFFVVVQLLHQFQPFDNAFFGGVDLPLQFRFFCFERLKSAVVSFELSSHFLHTVNVAFQQCFDLC